LSGLEYGFKARHYSSFKAYRQRITFSYWLQKYLYLLTFLKNIHPRVFEKNITENKIKLKSKRKKSSFVKIPLNPVQILHFKLLLKLKFF